MNKKIQGSANQTATAKFQQAVPKNRSPDTRHLKPETTDRHPAAIIQQTTPSIRPFIIPIFLPHGGCPHQCVFCNQVPITGSSHRAIDLEQIRSQIERFLTYIKKKRRPVQISFYGGNFLGLQASRIKPLLDLATEFVKQDQVDSIRFSTRPDTISPKSVEIIKSYPVKTVELGVQSMDDQVLVSAGRGHSAAETVLAVHLLRTHELEIGLQMMVGLPGDSEASSLITAEKIAALQPDFVRIYPTIVVKNSQLARWYQSGTYTPLTLEQAVIRVKTLFRYFNRHNIKIIRMGLQASADLEEGQTILAGPYHPAFGHMVYSAIFFDAAIMAISSAKTLSDTITISVNPSNISKMRGLNNVNIKMLKDRYHFSAINILPDDSLAAGELRVGLQEGKKLVKLW
jgi:histone acetyltransferase (RNA polymerase elongator complex component)